MRNKFSVSLAINTIDKDKNSLPKSTILSRINRIYHQLITLCQSTENGLNFMNLRFAHI